MCASPSRKVNWHLIDFFSSPGTHRDPFSEILESEMEDLGFVVINQSFQAFCESQYYVKIEAILALFKTRLWRQKIRVIGVDSSSYP